VPSKTIHPLAKTLRNRNKACRKQALLRDNFTY
jgi:hypothetical protein